MTAPSFHVSKAIVRRPGADATRGLTAANLGPADGALLSQQHGAYVDALRRLGVEVVVLEPLDGCPDAYFVEDVAVIVPGAAVAVLTRPGAPSRRAEVDSIEGVLATEHAIERIVAPGTLDGGDVLFAGQRAFIGVSARTNRAGAEQLGGILARHGFETSLIDVGSGLHLKSSVSVLDGSTLVVTEPFAGRPALAHFEQIVLGPGDAGGANLVRIGGQVLLPSGHPRLVEAIHARALQAVELEVSEIAKMDGGLTCLSLRLTGAQA